MIYQSYILDDRSKEPLAGATVTVIDTKGNKSTRARATDANGLISIEVNKGEGLFISFVGYKNRIITPNTVASEKRTDNDVVWMNRADTNLPPVMVTAKRQTTGGNKNLLLILALIAFVIAFSLIFKSN